ncbi:MAG TPA: phosphoribulokinase [Gemmatimonadaceae bacterium]|jgi:phosphoribulokinase|nr:phosphoribulokinase [Gemmatimonadaceae bacterium]
MIRRRPIILGIVGDSAAGKTTLTSGLIDIIGSDRVTHVCTDDYHRYDRQERAALGITALHPDCNYIDVMEMHLEQLHYGQPILKPVYDHSTGTLVRPEYVVPREFVIVEGLLGFSTAVLRQFLDVKVYLDPPESVRREWKLKRDTTKRGYTAEQVLAELEKREADSRDYIRPQREHADIVVRFYQPDEATSRTGDLNVRLVLRPTIAHPDLTYLVEETRSPGSGIRLELGRDRGRPADFLEIAGDVASTHAEELEEVIWSHLPGMRATPGEHLGGAYQDRATTRRSNQLALTQLLLSYHLLRNYNDLDKLPFASPVAALSRMGAAPADAAAHATASP